MKDALDTTREITKLIKYSQRRDGIFHKLKETLPVGSTPCINVICPTRWTACAVSIHSILANYETMQITLEEAIQATHDTEAKARIQKVAAQMKTFTYLFGSMLSKLVLKHTDNLSRTLQHVSMSVAEGQQVTSMTVATLNSMRSDDQFDLFGIWSSSRQKNSVSVILSCPGKESSLAGMMTVHPVETFHQHPRHTSSRLTLKLLT